VLSRSALALRVLKFALVRRRVADFGSAISSQLKFPEAVIVKHGAADLAIEL